MCEFSTGRNTCCVEDPPKTEGTCPLCFDSPVPARNYGIPDSCNLANCIGQPPFAPCGSATCNFADLSGPVCDEKICPYIPAPLIDCKRPDGTRCNAYGAPTCLTEEPTKRSLRDKLKYRDFSKYTFDKSKYLPKSYLPGDGADFMLGYQTKPYPEETGAGLCGSSICGLSSLDYVLQKLNTPIDPLPSVPYTGTSYYNKTFGTPYTAAPKVVQPTKSLSSSKEGCGAPDCWYEEKEKKQTPESRGKSESDGTKCPYLKKEGCGAPDCKYNKPTKKTKQGCGAPDCKYAQKSESETCPEACDETKTDETKTKKKKNKGKGDYESFGSCTSEVCPFAGMVKSEGSKVSCDNPECPFAKRPDPECNDKSCLYAKELVICQDCGGVILEGVNVELAPQAPVQPETVNATYSSPPLKTSIEIEKVKRLSNAQRKEMNKENEADMERRRTLGSMNEESRESSKRKNKKDEVTYRYPGTILGHRDCMKKKKNIPSNMGWLWNIKPSVGNPELWRGYKPGAICKTVHKMIRKHRRALGIYDPSDLMRKKKSKTSTRALSDKNKRVIQVRKKDGNYTVTMTPIKDPLVRHEHESIYVDCTPVQFRIAKPEKPPKPVTVDENGCACELKDDEKSKASSSDMSELDFNFSPPGALPIKPRKKKIKITKDTQYDEQDLKSQKKPQTPKGGSLKESKKKGKKKTGFAR